MLSWRARLLLIVIFTLISLCAMTLWLKDGNVSPSSTQHRRRSRSALAPAPAPQSIPEAPPGPLAALSAELNPDTHPYLLTKEILRHPGSSERTATLLGLHRGLPLACALPDTDTAWLADNEQPPSVLVTLGEELYGEGVRQRRELNATLVRTLQEDGFTPAAALLLASTVSADLPVPSLPAVPPLGSGDTRSSHDEKEPWATRRAPYKSTRGCESSYQGAQYVEKVRRTGRLMCNGWSSVFCWMGRGMSCELMNVAVEEPQRGLHQYGNRATDPFRFTVYCDLAHDLSARERRAFESFALARMGKSGMLPVGVRGQQSLPTALRDAVPPASQYWEAERERLQQQKKTRQQTEAEAAQTTNYLFPPPVRLRSPQLRPAQNGSSVLVDGIPTLFDWRDCAGAPQCGHCGFNTFHCATSFVQSALSLAVAGWPSHAMRTVATEDFGPTPYDPLAVGLGMHGLFQASADDLYARLAHNLDQHRTRYGVLERALYAGPVDRSLLWEDAWVPTTPCPHLLPTLANLVRAGRAWLDPQLLVREIEVGSGVRVDWSCVQGELQRSLFEVRPHVPAPRLNTLRSLLHAASATIEQRVQQSIARARHVSPERARLWPLAGGMRLPGVLAEQDPDNNENNSNNKNNKNNNNNDKENKNAAARATTALWPPLPDVWLTQVVRRGVKLRRWHDADGTLRAARKGVMRAGLAMPTRQVDFVGMSYLQQYAVVRTSAVWFSALGAAVAHIMWLPGSAHSDAFQGDIPKGGVYLVRVPATNYLYDRLAEWVGVPMESVPPTNTGPDLLVYLEDSTTLEHISKLAPLLPGHATATSSLSSN